MSNWLLFFVMIIAMLFIDLRANYKNEDRSLKKDITLTLVWIGMALLFNVYVFYQQGAYKALQFFMGYLVEKSLSIDNIFVFLVIFQSFKIDFIRQKKILLWGVMGAIIARIIFIVLGIFIVEKFSWIFYIFGAMLIYTSGKLLKNPNAHPNLNDSKFVALLYKYLPIVDSPNCSSFFIKQNNRIVATRLFLLLIIIEISDIVFAIDSVPAILSITQDPYIVITSNVFAILGLRSLFFVLGRFANKFKYLPYGLSIILGFIGLKMLLHQIIDFSWYISLIVIILALFGTIIASIINDKLPQRS